MRHTEIVSFVPQVSFLAVKGTADPGQYNRLYTMPIGQETIIPQLQSIRATVLDSPRCLQIRCKYYILS